MKQICGIPFSIFLSFAAAAAQSEEVDLSKWPQSVYCFYAVGPIDKNKPHLMAYHFVKLTRNSRTAQMLYSNVLWDSIIEFNIDGSPSGTPGPGGQNSCTKQSIQELIASGNTIGKLKAFAR